MNMTGLIVCICLLCRAAVSYGYFSKTILEDAEKVTVYDINSVFSLAHRHVKNDTLGYKHCYKVW